MSNEPNKADAPAKEGKVADEPTQPLEQEQNTVQTAQEVLDEIDANEAKEAAPDTEKQPEPKAGETQDAKPKEEDGTVQALEEAPDASGEGDGKKPQSPLLTRRQKRREAAAKDKAKIADLEAKLAANRAELDNYKTVDTDTAEDYNQAVADNAAVKALKAQKQAQIEAQAQSVETQKREIQVEAAKDFLEAGKELEHIKDFQEKVFDPELPISDEMTELMLSGDLSPEAAYKIATDSTLLDRINALSPTQRILKLGRIEEENAAPAPVKTSKAPEPLEVTDGKEGVKHQKPEGEMSYQEMRASLGMNPDKPGYRESE